MCAALCWPLFLLFVVVVVVAGAVAIWVNAI